MKKVIVFDMDGVLFDSVTIAEDAFLENYPAMTRVDHKELLTGNIHEELKKFKELHEEVSRTEEEKEVRSRTYSENKSNVGMYNGMKDLVDKLHQDGYVLVINTSAYERNCLPLLEKAGIKNNFDFVATGEVSRSKVEKFKTIEEKYAVDVNNILFITDTLGDIREADSAHIPTVAVLWGSHDMSYFTREPHENLKSIVASPQELGAYIYEYYEKRGL